MFRKFLFLPCIVLVLYAKASSETDSVTLPPEAWTFTPRFNTLNMAPVSGNIVNNHVNFDFSLVYTKNRFMWMTVNGVDLGDLHSDMNYFLTNLRYKINIAKNLSISPFLAFYSEHSYQLIDSISDFNSGVIFSYQRGPLIIEAFALFVRLTHEKTSKDLINRFEIRYKLPTVLLSGFVFQNTDHFDGRRRLALGFKAALPEFKIVKKVMARAEITGSFGIAENPETKNINGVFLSLAFPIRS